MTRLLIGIISFLLCWQYPYAQNTGHYLNFNTGLTHVSTRDKGFSPLVYQGTLFRVDFGYHHYHTKFIDKVDLIGNAGRITSAIFEEYPGSYQIAANFSLRYDHQRLLKKIEKPGINLYLGGAFNSLVAGRLSSYGFNNSFNYDWITYLAVAASVYKRIKIKKKVADVYGQLTLPFVAFVVRPAYASSLPEGWLKQDVEPFKDLLDSGYFTSWNNLQLVHIDLGFTYYLKPNNGLRVGYEWQFYNYDRIEVNEISSAIHSLYLSFLFKL